MLKPTRTVLALASGSLVLGLLGAGVSVAATAPGDEGPRKPPLALGMPGDDDGRYGEDEEDYDSGEHRHTYGKVVSQGPLSVRSRPSTDAYLLGKVSPHRKLALKCKAHGEEVAGNDLWYLLDVKRHEDGHDGTEPLDGLREPQDGGGPEVKVRDRADRRSAWVSARYVKNLGPVKWCRH
ncbi:hypothetical protein [Streptomyces sp. RerS4]|uniref:hypothetical protein n=1 Tax=Streptomyces sp. RerS4 TaxID=2942449 RepID=UPI00201BDE7C|nr:hypothetical protein [Streptomyces sp. RerS4]UQX04261.1 hypothetical protein M4D82_29970 [Streptomyces sp. RerS4]